MSKEKASQRIDSKMNTTKERNRVSPLILIVPVVLIAVVIGTVIITLGGKESKSNFVVTPENVEEIIASQKEEERTPIGSYEVKMSTEWHFSDSTAVSEDAYIENVVNNNNTVFFTIALPNSTIDFYKSPYIPVGSSLKNVQFDHPLGPEPTKRF